MSGVDALRPDCYSRDTLTQSISLFPGDALNVEQPGGPEAKYAEFALHSTYAKIKITPDTISHSDQTT
jgi:hypothetical protein